jgi:hypothetical protein
MPEQALLARATHQPETALKPPNSDTQRLEQQTEMASTLKEFST